MPARESVVSPSRLSFVLVHSPLVGPATWRPTAEALRARGYAVIVPSLVRFDQDGPPYYEKLTRRVAAAVNTSSPADALVVVGHSGAGALLPSVAAALGDAPMAKIFVDALLPHPGRSWMDTAPPALQEQLRSLAVDGRLPPWHEWFPPGTVEALLPDTEQRAGVLAEIPRLPLAYFEEAAPPADGGLGRCGYLQLSAPYTPFADEAERRGWPTIREASNHLAIVTEPELIVGRLLDLLGALTPGAQSGGHGDSGRQTS